MPLIGGSARCPGMDVSQQTCRFGFEESRPRGVDNARSVIIK